MKCFFHQSDLDGACSAAIVKKFYPEAQLVGINYGQPFPWDDIEPNEAVWMVDFCLQPFEDMIRLANITNTLCWIDHHKTAIDESEAAHVDKALPGLREIGTGACELVWRYMQAVVVRITKETDPVPLAVRLIAAHDVWDHTDPRTLPFQYGMRMYDTRPDNEAFWAPFLTSSGFWAKYLDPPPTDPIIESTIEQGAVILAYEMKQNANYAKSAAFEVMLDGLKCIAINRLFTNSKIFDSVWDPHKYDAMLAFGFRGGQWTVSLYSDRDDIDVGDVAKRRGGGGHKGAAGFQCTVPPFFPRASDSEAINL